MHRLLYIGLIRKGPYYYQGTPFYNKSMSIQTIAPKPSARALLKQISSQLLLKNQKKKLIRLTLYSQGSYRLQVQIQNIIPIFIKRIQRRRYTSLTYYRNIQMFLIKHQQLLYYSLSLQTILFLLQKGKNLSIACSTTSLYKSFNCSANTQSRLCRIARLDIVLALQEL